MSDIMYGIKSPYYKEIRPFWCGYYAHQARQFVSESYGESWSKLYRRGFRVVKIRIVPVAASTSPSPVPQPTGKERE